MSVRLKDDEAEVEALSYKLALPITTTKPEELVIDAGNALPHRWLTSATSRTFAASASPKRTLWRLF